MENTQNNQPGQGPSDGGAGSSSAQGSLTGVASGALGEGHESAGGGGSGEGAGAGAGGSSSEDDETKKNPSKSPSEPIKGRVLRDGEYGKINDVVILTEAQAKRGRKSGDVDTSAAAVEYAELIKAVG